MSKKRVFPLVAAVSLGLSGLVAVGCHAEAKFGTEAKAPEPPPPPVTPPPPPPAEPKPEPKAIKAIGKAKITGDQIQIPGKINFELNKATIKETKESELVRRTLGDHVFDRFVTNKLNEWYAYREQVTDWEIEQYYSKL